MLDIASEPQQVPFQENAVALFGADAKRERRTPEKMVELGGVQALLDAATFSRDDARKKLGSLHDLAPPENAEQTDRDLAEIQKELDAAFIQFSSVVGLN